MHEADSPSTRRHGACPGLTDSSAQRRADLWRSDGSRGNKGSMSLPAGPSTRIPWLLTNCSEPRWVGCLRIHWSQAAHVPASSLPSHQASPHHPPSRRSQTPQKRQPLFVDDTPTTLCHLRLMTRPYCSSLRTEWKTRHDK